MNKKRILVYVIAAAVVVGSSSFVYASKNSVESTKNVVESTAVEAEKVESETKSDYISDEEAVEIATKAMKDYLNKDSDYFNDTQIIRQNWSKDTEIEVEGQKYLVSKSYASWIQYRLDDNNIEGAKEELQRALKDKPNTVSVLFDGKENEGKFAPNGVDIDADTREVLSVMAHNKIEEFKGEPDTNKIKESIINFFNKINTEVDEESIMSRFDVDYEYGRVIMHFKLKDGNKVSAMIDLKDYSMISYTKDYLLYPEN